VFDENGALLQAPDALWQALAHKQWEPLFGTLRPLWAQARLVLFGHALLEKLATPRKAITAHVLRVDAGAGGTTCTPGTPGWPQHLGAPMLAAKPFAPCRCWACRAGGRPTKRPRTSTPIPRCSVPPPCGSTNNRKSCAHSPLRP
jgi:hypothetical protein